MSEIKQVDGVSLVVGDVIEYVGTGHEYVRATVRDVEQVRHGAVRVSFSCPVHGRHDHLYTPERGFTSPACRVNKFC